MLIHRNNCTTPVDVTYTGKLKREARRAAARAARVAS